MTFAARTRSTLALLGVLALLGACASHQGHDMSMHEMNMQNMDMGVMASGAWSRATPPGSEIGAAYLQLDNHSGSDDRLLAASSDVAARVEIHESSMDQGMMKMRQLESVAIAAGDRVSLTPGGIHLMLIGLARPLAEGQRFEVELQFETAGTINVPVTVQAMGADGSAMDHSQHMQH